VPHAGAAGHVGQFRFPIILQVLCGLCCPKSGLPAIIIGQRPCLPELQAGTGQQQVSVRFQRFSFGQG
jgi:hypothetical protein